MLRSALRAAALILGLAVITTLTPAHAAGARSNVPVWGVIGDSITYGIGASSPSKAYPRLAGVPSVGNPGQGLFTFCWICGAYEPRPLVESFGDELAALQARGVNTVVVEIGINDLGQNQPDQRYFDGYASLLAQGASHGVRVILSTITPSTRHTGAQQAQRERVNAWIRSQGRYVDYAKALGGDAPAPGMLADGLHPSDRGHARMAAALGWMMTRLTSARPHAVCVRQCGGR